MSNAYYHITDLALLPTNPGIYHFYNAQDTIIYIGKAKNIKKRVQSYFNPAQKHSLKTQKMILEIAYLRITIVNSEYEALLLENNWIKNHQPKYNILLRDDKTYPYLCLTKERFPRLIATREINTKKGTYFGPFTDTQTLAQMLELIKTLYPLRTCHYDLSEKNITEQKFKVCLNYHIKNCQGPCVGYQKEADYQQMIVEIKKILKGDFLSIKKILEKKMQAAAQSLAFETAQDYKEKWMALEKYQVKSLITNPQNKHLDVFSLLEDEEYLYISYLKIQHGMMVFTKTEAIKKKVDITQTDDLFAQLMINYRAQYQSEAKTIVVNRPLPVTYDQLPWTVPQIGDKKKMVAMAIQNALLLKKKMIDQSTVIKRSPHKALAQLQKDLALPVLPIHIECFDNSNLQGHHPVAAMVCFKNGVPAKKEYRKFHIKTVQGPDDFASMQEIILRRYQRLLTCGTSLPQLIVIDGGKGQLNAALEALKALGIQSHVSIISIAKRLEEIFIPDERYPLCLDKRSSSLQLLQRIRDETHRFAITFHRNTRDKTTLQKTILYNIPGIGPATQQKLLHHYPSTIHIQKATLTALQSVVGKHKASLLKNYFSSNEK